jgi:hypothetical protein
VGESKDEGGIVCQMGYTLLKLMGSLVCCFEGSRQSYAAARPRSRGLVLIRRRAHFELALYVKARADGTKTMEIDGTALCDRRRQLLQGKLVLLVVWR